MLCVCARVCGTCGVVCAGGWGGGRGEGAARMHAHLLCPYQRLQLLSEILSLVSV